MRRPSPVLPGRGIARAPLAVGLVAAVLLPAAAGTAVAFSDRPQADSAPAIRGAWEAVEYALASGPRHPVRGRIVFTADEWLVLYFVMEDGRPRRGSGEGGRYTLEGDRLTFEHLYYLAGGEAMEGLPETPLELTVRDGDGPLEAARVELDGDDMTLRFPSGNAMSFRRGSSP